MLDRWSDEIVTISLVAFVALGIPFAIIEIVQPNYIGEYYRAVVEPDWPDVIIKGFLMTLAGGPLFVFPMAAIRGAFLPKKLASAILIGLCVQGFALTSIWAMAEGFPWWQQNVVLTVFLALLASVAASIIFHTKSRLLVKIEKLSDAN